MQKFTQITTTDSNHVSLARYKMSLSLEMTSEVKPEFSFSSALVI